MGFVAGMANSFADSSPVVLLHGQVRQEQYGRGASQQMAVAGLFRPKRAWPHVEPIGRG